jgi:O-antigen/teichoic acid export membrane protein
LDRSDVGSRHSVTLERMGAAQPQPVSQGQHFVRNVLWSWMGVVFSLVSGVLLAPYVIHRLGDERYGIWALVFSLVDYYAMVDLGFKSAVVKYVAHYRATGEKERIEELISTATVYFTLAAVAVLAATAVIAGNITRIFHVLPRDVSAFRFLAVTVGLGVAVSIAFSAFAGALDAYQRFDISSRIMIVASGVRSLGCFAALWAGFGLKAMGLCALFSMLLIFLLMFFSFRRLAPDLHFSTHKARFDTLRQMMGYGGRTVVANVSLNVLNQNGAVLIGHYLSAAMVAYFVFPLRLLNYSVELVGRLGGVTTSKSAELAAHGDTAGIARMAVIVNRYCLLLFFPLAVYLTVFGRQLLSVWLNPAFAAQSAPLMPVLGAGIVIAIAAQYNSTSILFGMARHGALARALLLEAVASIAGLCYAVPRYGIFAAACVVSGLMVASRGLYVPYVLSRVLKIGCARFLWQIFARPVALMAPVGACFWLANRALGQPATWWVAIGGGAAMAACYYPLGFFFGLDPGHRQMLLESVRTGFHAIIRSRAASK